MASAIFATCGEPTERQQPQPSSGAGRGGEEPTQALNDTQTPPQMDR
jgi:hypothetical protein